MGTVAISHTPTFISSPPLSLSLSLSPFLFFVSTSYNQIHFDTKLDRHTLLYDLVAYCGLLTSWIPFSPMAFPSTDPILCVPYCPMDVFFDEPIGKEARHWNNNERSIMPTHSIIYVTMAQCTQGAQFFNCNDRVIGLINSCNLVVSRKMETKSDGCCVRGSAKAPTRLRQYASTVDEADRLVLATRPDRLSYPVHTRSTPL